MAPKPYTRKKNKKGGATRRKRPQHVGGGVRYRSNRVTRTRSAFALGRTDCFRETVDVVAKLIYEKYKMDYLILIIKSVLLKPILDPHELVRKALYSDVLLSPINWEELIARE